MKYLIAVLILFPALANANGQLYRSGFIVDAADERNTLRTPSLNEGNSTVLGHESDRHWSRATSRERVQIAVSGVHQYIFNDTDSINAHKQHQFNTVKIADSWSDYHVGR